MPIKTYEQKLQEEAARKRQVAQQLEQRKQELDAFAQMEAQRKAEQDAALQESYKTYKRVQIYKEALERGEIDPAQLRANIVPLEQVYATNDALQRQQQREIEATPEHQSFVQAFEWSLPPAARAEKTQQYFASQREITVDESYSALQAAKQDVAKEEKQLKALQSGRVLSPGELPYQQQRLEQAKQQEQQALQQFNELAGVPVE